MAGPSGSCRVAGLPREPQPGSACPRGSTAACRPLRQLPHACRAPTGVGGRRPPADAFRRRLPVTRPPRGQRAFAAWCQADLQEELWMSPKKTAVTASGRA